MALEGNLTAFGLSEILQLIAVQQKTGMLTVTNVDSTTVMFFRSGEIVSTRDRRRKARDSFKDYLTRYGVLEREQLLRISQISTQSKLDFTEILTSEGFLTREELLKHWRKQVLESMHDVLTWEEGTYKFVTSNEIVDGIKYAESFNVEGMLMESMRRIDEFPQMLEMFPSERLLFSKRDDEPLPEEVTENEKDIYELLTRQTSLRDLIARGKMPVFEVYESLKLLQDKELVSVEEPESEGEDDTVDRAQRRARRRVTKNVLPFLVAAILFLGAIFVGFRDQVRSLAPETVSGLEVLSDDDLSREHLEYRLRWLIEAYHAQYGVYPPSLTSLVDAGLAPATLIEAARERAFRYRLTANRAGYTLL